MRAPRFFLETKGPTYAVSAHRKQKQPTHTRRCFTSGNPREPKSGFIERTPTRHCLDTHYVSVFLAYADGWDEDDEDCIDSAWDDDAAWGDHDQVTDWGGTVESPDGALRPNTQQSHNQDEEYY